MAAEPSRLQLRAAVREAYVRRARRLVSDRRINRSFVPAREIGRLFDHLVAGRAAALDARDTLDVDPCSGLPTLPEFLRALARLKARAQGPGLQRFRVEARVRRSLGQSADLKVRVDRFDPARSLFVRATLELNTEVSREVTLDGDRATLSGDLEQTLFTFVTAAPQVLAARLRQVDGITLNGLTVGVTGPLVFAGIRAPEELAAVVRAEPGVMLLRCSLHEVDAGGQVTTRNLHLVDAAHADVTRTTLPGQLVWSVDT